MNTLKLAEQCREAAKHLKPGGELRLVANNFLKYSPIIEAHLGPCVTLAAAHGLHLYQAKRPVEVRTSNRESRAERDWRRNL